MNPEIPTKTKTTVTLANGETVTVKILNELQRSAAQEKAERIALNECMCYAKGGNEFAAVQSRVRNMDAEAQSSYLTQMDYPKLWNEVETALPLPLEPDRGEKEPADYARAVQQWEQDAAEVKAKREADIERRYTESIAKYKSLSARERNRLCEDAFFAQEYGKAYSLAYVLEVLHRAVRKSESILERYYSSAAAVEDAPDADREALWNAYEQMDVKPDEIPTSPVG